MQVAILAGGMATRLGSLSRKRPKSLVEIAGTPFLEYQLEQLRRGGVGEVLFCIGHLGQQIQDYLGNGWQYGMKIRYSLEDRPLGTAGALRRAEPLLSDKFFTLYGDSYLFLDFGAIMRFFRSQDRLALMTVFRNYDRYERSNTVVEGNLVARFSKKERAGNMVYIEYGANLFRREVLRMIPENQFYSLDDLFPRLIEQKELLAYEVRERFYEIGSPQGLRDFEQYIKVLRGQDDTLQGAN